VVLLVNEQTLLPAMMPPVPASTLARRFPGKLPTVLANRAVGQAFIANELASMTEVALAKTANRSVVGTMNEFAFLAEGYREYLETSDWWVLSMRLADTPCSTIKYNSTAGLIKDDHRCCDAPTHSRNTRKIIRR
jgi:hypothetical protein